MAFEEIKERGGYSRQKLILKVTFTINCGL
jgi:hypothetical protein